MKLKSKSINAALYHWSGLALVSGAIPLAYFLPTSVLAQSVTFLLFFVLQMSGLGLLPNPKIKIFLQLVNAGVMLSAVWLLFGSASYLSSGAEFWTVLGAVAGLLVLVMLFYAEGKRRITLMVQYGVIAHIVLQLRYISETNWVAEPVNLSGHFLMGLRALFLGPLGLFAVVFLWSHSGWNRLLVAAGAVCIGQFAIGLIEVGVRVASSLWISLGMLFAIMFFLVLWLACSSKGLLTRKQQPSSRSGHP
jgi:hypothetical protein